MFPEKVVHVKARQAPLPSASSPPSGSSSSSSSLPRISIVFADGPQANSKSSIEISPRAHTLRFLKENIPGALTLGRRRPNSPDTLILPQCLDCVLVGDVFAPGDEVAVFTDSRLFTPGNNRVSPQNPLENLYVPAADSSALKAFTFTLQLGKDSSLECGMVTPLSLTPSQLLDAIAWSFGFSRGDFRPIKSPKGIISAALLEKNLQVLWKEGAKDHLILSTK